ncbi:PI-PLC domain-containing protein [Reichenbachiella versicolor]|uniref:hypothetical protein n=1 Tax=Reichenbachiella versicolor TaxID=1821036 RepID=UPI000D6DDACE|nr:hypothetical protein [Reichenbachiella versicolor]
MRNDNIDSASWMGQLADSIKLNEIIMPGSHDAGMSVLHHCDIGSKMNKGMVQTQELKIADQLKVGSRYFDIRVDYDHKKLVTYHRTGNLGCNGQSLEQVMNESVAFLQEQKTETFILKFSHIRSNRGMEREIKDRIDQFLSNINFRPYFFTSSNQEVNLVELSLGEVRGKMILVFDYVEYISTKQGHLRYYNALEKDDKGNFAIKLKGPNINIADAYTNTTSLKKMSEDQINKQNDFGGLGKEYLFLLSWTLTPGAGTFFGGSIRELAGKANRALPKALSGQKEEGNPMPNIVYVDYVNKVTAREIIQYNFR